MGDLSSVRMTLYFFALKKTGSSISIQFSLICAALFKDILVILSIDVMVFIDYH